MLIGVLFGLIMSQMSFGKSLIVNYVKPFGTIFINSLKLIAIPLTKNYSIPYTITGKYGAANVIIKPAVAGSGVLAGGSVRTVLELSGIQNISAKQLGCDNLLNNARATMCALKSIKNQNLFNKTS